MSKIEKLIDIAAPPERVFDLFSELENVPRWLPAVREARLSEGNRSVWTLGTDGGYFNVNAEVVERRAPDFIRWRVSDGAATTDIAGHVIETQKGSSILRLAIDDDTSRATANGHSLALRLFGASDAGEARRSLDDSLARFKEFVVGASDDETTQTRIPVVATIPESRGTVAPLGVAAGVVASGVAAPFSFPAAPRETGRDDFAADDADATLIRPSTRISSTTHDRPASSHVISMAATPITEPLSPSPSRAAPTDTRRSLLPVALAAALALAALCAAWLFTNRAGRVADPSPPPQTTSAAVETVPESTTPPAFSQTPVAQEERPPATAVTEEPRASAVNTEPADADAESPVASSPVAAVPRSAPAEETAVLRRSVDEWIGATNGADLDAQMNFYAPTIERYYLRRNFQRAAVRRDKAELMARARVTDMTIGTPQISFSPDGRTATMRFRKDYNIADLPGRHAVLQELRWRKTDDGWRIVSERDLQVLR